MEDNSLEQIKQSIANDALEDASELLLCELLIRMQAARAAVQMLKNHELDEAQRSEVLNIAETSLEGTLQFVDKVMLEAFVRHLRQ